MQPIYIRFSSGRTFQITESIQNVDKEKTPYFLFFDVDKLKAFFQIDGIFDPSHGSFYYLSPTKLGIQHATYRDGNFYTIVFGESKSASYLQTHQDSEVAAAIRENGFLVISETHPVPNCELIREDFVCDIFKTVTNGYAVPISYSPFCNYEVGFDANRDNVKVLSFGGENKFDLAYLSGNSVKISASIEKLEGLSEIEEMDRIVNAMTGGLDMKDVHLLGGYNHYSIVGNYLRRFTHVKRVNHVYSHLAAAMYDHKTLNEPSLGIVYDSTSVAEDESIQGSEFVFGTPGNFRTLGRWKPLPLPGGDIANIEPWRISLAIIKESFKGDIGNLEIPLIKKILENKSAEYLVKAILKGDMTYTLSSSMHHLVSALGELLWYKESTFDMDFFEGFLGENIAESGTGDYYPTAVVKYEEGLEIDSYDLFKQLIADLFAGQPMNALIGKSIYSIAKATGELASQLAKQKEFKKVFLTGEFFKNPTFLTLVWKELSDRGFDVRTHKTIPIDDSGVAVGQIVQYFYEPFKGK